MFSGVAGVALAEIMCAESFPGKCHQGGTIDEVFLLAERGNKTDEFFPMHLFY